MNSQPEDNRDELDGTPKPGELIGGKYEVDGIIGIGGMGVVLGGTHLHLQQPVAIKVLLPEFVKNQDIRGRFLREARSAARLRSDHVTRIYDVGALDNGLPFMVMERLEGINLADALQEHGPFEVQSAVGYVLQACEAVAEAHAAGIVHRDLKPANLYLANKPNGSQVIKVLDFGISKTVDERNGGVPALTGPHSLLGSPHYMSPEQIRDSSEVDARTDVWALGVLLYELISRHMPFEAMSLPHLYARILSEPPIALESRGIELPDGLNQTILACLDKSRESRIPDVGELAERLAPFGPPWAQSSVEHVRHALERRPSSPSAMPASVPVCIEPTPTQMGSQTTIAARPGKRPRNAVRWWPWMSVGVLVAVGASVAVLQFARSIDTAPSQVAVVMDGLAAHRFSAQHLEQPAQSAVRPVSTSATPAEPVPASAEHAAPSNTGARTNPRGGERSVQPGTVRDLKSITLID